MTNDMISDISSLESLLAAIRLGWQPKYLFFWSHEPSSQRSIDKSCLSQWFDARFELDGIVYPSAEHYMMAEKARLFYDDQILQEILKAPHPRAAKSLGRMVSDFSEHVWQEHRFEIVVRGNEAKFSQNHELKDYLRNSRNRVLVEASPWDKVWGIGVDEKDERALYPKQWQGLNLLGFALMKVRATL